MKSLYKNRLSLQAILWNLKIILIILIAISFSPVFAKQDFSYGALNQLQLSDKQKIVNQETTTKKIAKISGELTLGIAGAILGTSVTWSLVKDSVTEQGHWGFLIGPQLGTAFGVYLAGILGNKRGEFLYAWGGSYVGIFLVPIIVYLPHMIFGEPSSEVGAFYYNALGVPL